MIHQNEAFEKTLSLSLEIAEIWANSLEKSLSCVILRERHPEVLFENRWTVFYHEFQSIIGRIHAKNNENLSVLAASSSREPRHETQENTVLTVTRSTVGRHIGRHSVSFSARPTLYRTIDTWPILDRHITDAMIYIYFFLNLNVKLRRMISKLSYCSPLRAMGIKQIQWVPCRRKQWLQFEK